MSYPNTFQRYELKYLIGKSQRDALKALMAAYMKGDDYGKTTVCNLYYDTPSRLLIRRSMDKPVYKEKLRVRSYGAARPGETVFVELKKKYQSVVYKRRAAMTEREAMAYLQGKTKPCPGSQITREIDYFLRFYQELTPSVFLSYDREAFFAKDGSGFRVTFDQNILWRENKLSLCGGVGGCSLLKDGQVLMEIKTAGAIPLWLTGFLSENQIYKTSFSKYGSAYQAILNSNRKGDTRCA